VTFFLQDGIGVVENESLCFMSFCLVAPQGESAPKEMTEEAPVGIM
jgi:hypothetical protein